MSDSAVETRLMSLVPDMKWGMRMDIALEIVCDKIEALDKTNTLLVKTLRDFVSTSECKREWIDEMQGTIEAILSEVDGND